VLLALLVVACGGGGSGSDGGGSGGGGDAATGLLIRWRATGDAEGYVIHWGTESGEYVHALDVGAPEQSEDGIASFLLEDPGTSGTIYFALTSYDAEGRMSAFSNELAAEIP
jgi:hypothetical protein